MERERGDGWLGAGRSVAMGDGGENLKA